MSEIGAVARVGQYLRGMNSTLRSGENWLKCREISYDIARMLDEENVPNYHFLKLERYGNHNDGFVRQLPLTPRLGRDKETSRLLGRSINLGWHQVCVTDSGVVLDPLVGRPVHLGDYFHLAFVDELPPDYKTQELRINVADRPIYR